MMVREPIIFLDIDGVLNRHDFDDDDGIQSSTLDPECVAHLNRILGETDARIVLSSAWRYMVHGGAMTLDGFEYLLRTHGVAARGRLIGLTPLDEDIEPRGLQIRHWLNEHGDGRRYLVIDDGGSHPDGTWSDLGIHGLHPVLWTKGNVGLTDWDAHRAIESLMGRPVASIDRRPA